MKISQNFDFDRMIEYGTGAVDQSRTIPNPEYRKLTYQLKKKRDKKSRLEARMFQQLEGTEAKTIDQFIEDVTKNSTLIDQIEDCNEEINKLLERRNIIPGRISIAEMPEEKRYNKLKQESKKLKNAILMIAYRAESTLYNVINDFYVNNSKDGRMLLKEIFTSDADIVPDYDSNTLNILLHSLSTPRANEVVKKLCDFLNQTETYYPGTNLLLKYKSVAD